MTQMKKAFYALALTLIVACATQAVIEQTVPVDHSKDVQKSIENKTVDAIVASTSCKDFSWKDRGRAPIGFVHGLALAYQQTKCDKDLAARLTKAPHSKEDAYSRYGLSPTLPNIYTLMLGLGMREASGRIVCGRDMSAGWTSSDTAESGAWQTSLNSKAFSSYLYPFFKSWNKQCFQSEFMKGVVTRSGDLKNWGTGADGLAFQKKSKECGPFQLEYTALLLKETYRHHGPLVRKEVQIVDSCKAMFEAIDKITNCP